MKAFTINTMAGLSRFGSVLILMLTSVVAEPRELYRSPIPGDKGTYYIIEKSVSSEKKFEVLASRVGPHGEYTGFTRLLINCNTHEYLVLAYGEESGNKKRPSKSLKDISDGSKWTDLVIGSSKYDLVQFVCKNS